LLGSLSDEYYQGYPRAHIPRPIEKNEKGISNKEDEIVLNKLKLPLNVPTAFLATLSVRLDKFGRCNVDLAISHIQTQLVDWPLRRPASDVRNFLKACHLIKKFRWNVPERNGIK
jgi:hypothetical protein